MTPDEARVVEQLVVFERELPPLLEGVPPGSHMDRHLQAGLNLPQIVASAGMHRRAARRALARLIEAGTVRCTNGWVGDYATYRLTDAAMVRVEQLGR